MVGGLYNAILFRTFHPIGRDSLVVVMSGTSDCGLCCLLLMQFILRPLIGPGKKVRKPGSSLRLGLLTTILISLHILHLPSPLRRERPRPPRVSSHSVSAPALREHKLVIFVKGWPSSLLRSTKHLPSQLLDALLIVLFRSMSSFGGDIWKTKKEIFFLTWHVSLLQFCSVKFVYLALFNWKCLKTVCRKCACKSLKPGVRRCHWVSCHLGTSLIPKHCWLDSYGERLYY